MWSLILGALTAFVPGILQLFTQRSQNAFQLERDKLQIEAAREGKAFDVVLADRATDAEQQRAVYNFANQPTGVEWVDSVSVLVRPYITIVLFHMWLAVEVTVLLYAIRSSYDIEKTMAIVWDESTKDMLKAVVGFWFGSRMLVRGQQAAPIVQAAITRATGGGNEVRPRAPVTRNFDDRAMPAIQPAPLGDRS